MSITPKSWKISLTILGLCLIAVFGVLSQGNEHLSFEKIPLSDASAVNNKGQIVGSVVTGTGEGHAFLWSKEDGMIDIGNLGGSEEYYAAYGIIAIPLLAINDKGEITGGSKISTGDTHAFVWSKEEGMIDIGTLGGKNSYAFSINNRGQIVGHSDTSTGEEHAFVWSKEDGMIGIGTLGGKNSYASAINDKGQILGIVSVPPSIWVRGWSWLSQKLNWPKQISPSAKIQQYRDEIILWTIPPKE